MRIVIYPYKMKSKSAKALQDYFKNQGVSCIRVSQNSQTYKYRKGDYIINYGSKNFPAWSYPKFSMLNYVNPFHHKLGLDGKLEVFKTLKKREVSVPEFTSNKAIAGMMISNGDTIVARKLLHSSKGKGISLHKDKDTLVDAPLYVKYIPKQSEYRVHILNGKVIDVQQKRKRKGEVNVNYQIRNVANGWVFCRENVMVPLMVTDESVKAVAALGLTFGAADVVWNAKHSTAYVLEVNTAPGLEGTTVDNYGKAFLNYIKELKLF